MRVVQRILRLQQIDPAKEDKLIGLLQFQTPNILQSVLCCVGKPKYFMLCSRVIWWLLTSTFGGCKELEKESVSYREYDVVVILQHVCLLWMMVLK